jgi:hypothetical protein
MAHSPWGKIQETNVFTRGFKSVSTSGHGGYMFTEEFAKKNLSERALAFAKVYSAQRYYCYEEDCDWAIPALELLDVYGDQIFAHSGADYATNDQRRAYLIRTLSHYHPEFLIGKGIEPDAEMYADYLAWQEDARLRAEQSPDLIVAACGSHTFGCTQDECRVRTADGKDHFITTKSYAARSSRKGPNLLSNCVLTRPYN